MPLIACELALETPHERERLVGTLRGGGDAPYLVLSTCQRIECYGIQLPTVDGLRITRTHSGRDAFARLARIAAGLESRILGELEVIGQVRDAYKSFQDDGGRALSVLDRIFQDALALAREARRESGIDRNLTSLAGLAARELLDRVPADAPLAVVGSGSIAGSVVRKLSKSGGRPVRIASRCPENAMSLAMEVGGFASGLDELSHLFHGAAGIITATAAPHALVFPHHVANAARPLVIVDLGAPADCAPDVRTLPDVTYISLEDVESRAQINSDERRQRAAIADEIIRRGADAWARRPRRPTTAGRAG